MIIIDKLKKNFGEKIAVDIEHYEINQAICSDWWETTVPVKQLSSESCWIC